MIHEKSKTVAFSGHRNNRITTDPATLARQLRATFDELYLRGKRTFLSGMAEGFDLLTAEAVFELKDRHPDVRLVCVIPFPEQASRYTQTDRRRFEAIYRNCDEDIILSKRYYEGCFHRRNDYLLDNASTLVTYYDGKPKGGTAYTVRMAAHRHIPIVNLAQKEKLSFGMLGNGVTVWDYNRQENRDYKTVAHIARNRQVTFHDPHLSLTARAQIERFALHDNMFPALQPGNYALEPLPDWT